MSIFFIQPGSSAATPSWGRPRHSMFRTALALLAASFAVVKLTDSTPRELRIATRPLGTATLHDQDGTARLTVVRPDWAALLDLALSEITQYGADSVQIHRLAGGRSGRHIRIDTPRREAFL
ncbi:DUF2254 family protein [Streptomyces sp. NPDC057067]|uniref:DUF2254 family protein n=1 Tax=Streptomyces TaxID=1883 RepID=UPI001F506D3F|nr:MULTISPECIES: DUF2254 family protein [Streptomyces]